MREKVKVKTLSGILTGELFVGADGLPELLVDCGRPEYYRPATYPAAWGPIVDAEGEDLWGPLLGAWWEIEKIRAAIVAKGEQ